MDYLSQPNLSTKVNGAFVRQPVGYPNTVVLGETSRMGIYQEQLGLIRELAEKRITKLVVDLSDYDIPLHKLAIIDSYSQVAESVGIIVLFTGISESDIREGVVKAEDEKLFDHIIENSIDDAVLRLQDL